jgi:CDP-diacylglycerol--glycerol-3-phosphate 3-phosphatidyltransferase
MATAAGAPGPGKQRARQIAGRTIEPVARTLLRWRISPDAVTLLGTLGVVAASLAFYARGEFLVGTLIIAVIAFSDMLDGTMARLSGRSSVWGAFLDSSLDRVADAAVLGGLAWWFLGDGNEAILGALALYAMFISGLVSYVRARAESLQLKAAGGIAERTERMVVVLLSTGLAGLGVPYVQAIGLWLLVIAATITVGQRMLAVRRQTR